MKQIGDNIWTHDSKLAAGPVGTCELGARMTAIRLANGIFLHSPVKLDPELKRQIDELGPVTVVVSPNRLHHLFVGDYFAAYPQAQIYAAPGLLEKRKDLNFHGTLADEPAPQWSRQLEQHLIRGASLMNETVFFHPPSRTLVTSELVFNMQRTESTFDAVVLRMLGDFGAVGVGYPGRLMFLMRREQNRASIDRILQWDFDRIIMAHGDIVESGGKKALRAAFSFL